MHILTPTVWQDGTVYTIGTHRVTGRYAQLIPCERTVSKKRHLPHDSTVYCCTGRSNYQYHEPSSLNTTESPLGHAPVFVTATTRQPPLPAFAAPLRFTNKNRRELPRPVPPGHNSHQQNIHSVVFFRALHTPTPPNAHKTLKTQDRHPLTSTPTPTACFGSLATKTKTITAEHGFLGGNFRFFFFCHATNNKNTKTQRKRHILSALFTFFHTWVYFRHSLFCFITSYIFHTKKQKKKSFFFVHPITIVPPWSDQNDRH